MIFSALCDYLPSENDVIKSQKVFEAMYAVDRKYYSKYNPYTDSPQSIGKS